MIKNYLKIAFRSLINHKGYSLINITGLSISLAVTLLMLLWVHDEWNIDKFHENGNNIFRVKRTIPLEGSSLDVYNGIPYPVLVAAVKELPEVEKYVALGRSFDESIQYKDLIFREKGTFGNASYFEVFSYPILIGDITELDNKVESLAISRKLAKKLFGNIWQSTTLGKVIEIQNVGEFSIDAVYEDFPPSSSIQNDFVYSFQRTLKKNEWMLEWGNAGMQGCLLLADGADPKTVASKIETLFHEHQEGDRKEGILLQKYADHYLYANYNEMAEVDGGRIGYVRTFGIAALLLLFISCINFVNLSTARASKRAKEVGVRKSIGAGKKSLITQFMIEAGVITLISIGLAYALAELLLPQVRMITGKMLVFDLSQPAFWIGFAGIFGLTTLLSGAYPAFVLSRFRPVTALKGTASQRGKSISLRKGLVVVQFVLALLLIVAALVVRQQVEYIKNKNLGIAKNNLLVIHQDDKITAQYDVLYNELITQKGIAGITLAGPSPLNMQASTNGVGWSEKRPDQENIEFSMLWTASNFLDVFDVPLVSGRFYREGSVYDTTNIVFNETAIGIMGLTNPIGKTVRWWGKPRQIIGVVKDFHNRSLYEKIEPAGILLDQDDAGWLFVKAEEGNMKGAIASLESTFKKVLPDVTLHFDFVDEQYQQQYQSETLTATLANFFALISILISCLGLFGLATFFAEQKQKEIGIRKVLGASVISLIQLLSKQFLVLVSIGLLVGIPVSAYLLKGWLANFEYGVGLQFWMFAAPVALAIIIASLTVGFQALRAAVANPVESLRNE
ncbi:MAG: ABC transporter permease [Saprospiraceae bacterium]